MCYRVRWSFIRSLLLLSIFRCVLSCSQITGEVEEVDTGSTDAILVNLRTKLVELLARKG
jgi:hypothetical protein